VLGAVEGVSAEVTDRRTVEARSAWLDSADLNEILMRAGVRVAEITPARRTLESYYLEAVRTSVTVLPEAAEEPPAGGETSNEARGAR
jgi:hypothetical protein